MKKGAKRANNSKLKALYHKLGEVDLLIALCIFILALSMSAFFARSYHRISVFDESVHFDYVYKVTQGELSPTPAETVSPETVNVIMCRPSVVYPNANCSKKITEQELPVHGINYVLAYAPVYYWPTAILSTLVHAILGTSWFVSARLSTVLLFSLGTVVFYVACRRYSASRASAAGVTIALTACPMLFASGSTVNPDSLGMLAAATVALVPTLKFSWRNKMIIAICVGIIIALIKPNFVPLGCIAVLLAGIMPKSTDKFNTRKIFYNKRFVISLCLAVVPLVVQILWNAFANSRLAPGMRSDGFLNDMLRTNTSPVILIIQSLQGYLNPLSPGSAFISSAALTFMSSVVAIMIGGSAVVAYSSNFINARIKLLAITGITGLLMTAIYVPVVLFVAYHAGGSQPRYGVPILVFMAIPVAVAINGRLSRWFPLIMGLIGTVIAFKNMI